MEYIRMSSDIVFKQGYNEYIIDATRDLDLSFSSTNDAEVFITVRKCGKLRIRGFMNAGTQTHILFSNESDASLEVDESYEVLRDAHLTVAYAECNAADTKRSCYVALRRPGASARVTNALLVNSRKDYAVNVVNFAPHTSGNIENYAVVLKHGNLVIDAIGKIVKGAKQSESHQSSHALSFEAGQKAKILPELLIDENDVQASHALSMGTVDEDQLYYLMSRGLSVEQCTSLISTGYLLPVTQVIQNEELQQRLKGAMERKIDELCSM